MLNDVKEQILNLKKEKNAVILAHYYVADEVQELADYVGDSYYLAKIAKENPADVIVFCGVIFMGESAKLLSPEKTVLLPVADADCPMAHMASLEKIQEIKDKQDDLAVVCYINSSVALKTLSDVCVTSSNAVHIVKNLPQKNILFIPDENLGRYCQKQVPEKNFIFNDGYCPIHAIIEAKDLIAMKEKHPNAIVLAHPECKEDILNLSDFIGSTSAIIAETRNNSSNEFIIATEIGILYELKRHSPNKVFHIITEKQCCDDMKKITLNSVLEALQENKHQVEVPEVVAKRAMEPLNKMLELAE